MSALIDELQRQLASTDNIDVITTIPNRYSSFNVAAPEVEAYGNVTIQRIQLPDHESGMLDQSKAFASFARAAWRLARREKYDVVLATSSRLVTAFLGALIARRQGAYYYLDIRDIFTDTLDDLLGKRSPLRFLLPSLRRMEKFTVKAAGAVNLVSEGFKEYFESLDPSRSYRFISNGIDDEFLGHDYHKHQGPERLRILYAGNTGAGQGLERIVPQLAKRLGAGYEVVVVGDGGTRTALESAVIESGCTNVTLEPPVDRPRLMEMYSEADVLFLHLNDFQAFHKVLPSKIFEYAATGKPILAGVAGYAARFIEDHVVNATVFAPCDVDGAVRALHSLDLNMTSRQDFIDAYSRRLLTQRLAEDIVTSSQAARRSATSVPRESVPTTPR